VVSFTPLPLGPLAKSPWYPLDRKLGGPQSRFGHGCEDKNSQPAARDIRMDLREVGWEGVDWSHLAEDRKQWRAVVNTVMNLRFP